MEPAVRQGFPLCSVTITSLLGAGGVGSQVDGAEVLEVLTQVALLRLSLCSPLSQHWLPCPGGGHCRSKRGLCGLCTRDGTGCGELAAVTDQNCPHVLPM